MRTIKKLLPSPLAAPATEITSEVRPLERAYSLAQAAEILGVSTYTAMRLGKSGALKIIRVSPRRIIVRPVDLLAYIASRPDTSAAR